MKTYVFNSPKSYMTAILEFLNDWRKIEMGIKDFKLHKYNTKVTKSTSEGLTVLKNQRCTVGKTHSLRVTMKIPQTDPQNPPHPSESHSKIFWSYWKLVLRSV